MEVQLSKKSNLQVGFFLLLLFLFFTFFKKGEEIPLVKIYIEIRILEASISTGLLPTIYYIFRSLNGNSYEGFE
jgi:hypothetical protein